MFQAARAGEYCQSLLLSSNLAAICNHPGSLHSASFLGRRPSTGELMTNSSQPAMGIRVQILVLLLAAAWQALAQGGATGAITGTVQDASGAVVVGADVRIINQ